MTFDFSGIWIPLITPLQQDMVDHDALRGLISNYQSSGIRGFASLSTTGEGSLLSPAQQDAVVHTTLQAAQGLPVIAGLSASNFSQLQQRLEQLSRFSLNGFMVSSPAYIRPSQQGLIEYFIRLADLSPFPLIIYEIPYRSGVRLELPSLLTLAQHSNIQAIKDCAGSMQMTQALIADGNLQVLAGEDFNIFSTLCMGGSGAIAAATHIHPELYVQLMQHIQTGNISAAQHIFHKLSPLIEQLFSEPNPAPLKGLLSKQNRISNELMFPLQPASDPLVDRLVQLSAQLEKTYSELF